MRKKIARLKENFQPKQYDLFLKVDSAKLKFEGKVLITGNKIGKPSKRLTLHEHNLTIKGVKALYSAKGDSVALKVSRTNIQKSFDELRIHFDQLIYPGEYKIEVEFSGKITKQMEGMYPCFYKEKGKEKKIIATQFESHHARDVFPCIDEPEAKAVFNLSLDTSDVKAVVSNTEIKSQRLVNKRLKTVFNPTPKMSTYLLAFVVGDMDYLETKNANGVKVRTYATPANVKHTKFALELAAKTLDFYTDYYGIAFPLPKCDFIALPDFANGAMEHWGCITFREQAMLVDEDNTSLSSKQYVANVVAHELAHQWFGNLVTMKWWNDLWLNESFASWMSYLAIDHLYPEWEVWTQFIVDEQERAMMADSLEHTHPIEVRINHPDEIRTIFDSISYEKGASVIAMLSNYLGADIFQRGINLYLKKHAYSNTSTADLWKALEEAAEKDVSQFMHSWVSLSGYPIVKIDSSDGKTRINQSRFFLNPKAPKSDDIWPVPVSSKKSNGQVALFYKKNALLSRDILDPDSLINGDRQGFYRVIYSTKQLDHLFDKNLHKLGPIDRLALLSDHVEAAKAGFSSSDHPLELLKYYPKDNELVVWNVIVGFLGSVKSVMRDEELRESIKPYLRSFVEFQLKRLTFKEKKTDSHFDKLLRPVIFGLAASADEPSALKEVKRLFKSGKVNPDYKVVVYQTIARLGGKKEFDMLHKMHQEADSSEEKLNLCVALTSFKQPELIKRSLAIITTDEVKLQDAFYWIAYSFGNYYSRDLAWQWLKDNWQWMYDNFSRDLSFFKMPNYVARNYSDPEFLKDYKTFFDSHMSPGLERSVKQGIETIQWQAAWRQRDLGLIKKFFKQASV